MNSMSQGSSSVKSGRTRTVLSDNAEVAHVWANQSLPEGRTSNGNFSFVGRTLYSYRTAIAKIAENAAGEQCVIATTRRYSVTTSGKHQTQIWRAARQYPIFHVYDIDGSPADIRAKMATAIEGEALEVNTARMAKTRVARFEALQASIRSKNEFCRFFGLPEFAPPASNEELERLAAEIKAQRAEADRIRNERLAKERAKAEKEARKALKQWLAGESVRVPYGFPCHYMRIEGEEITTTLGARVPIDHVRRVASRILEMVRAGQEWRPDRTIHLGYYTLDRIDENGMVYVGCHRFERKEIERVAKLVMA